MPRDDVEECRASNAPRPFTTAKVIVGAKADHAPLPDPKMVKPRMISVGALETTVWV